MRFAAKLAVDRRADGTHLGDAEITLSAMHAASPTSPCGVRRHGSVFILESEVELTKVVADAPPGRGVTAPVARVGKRRLADTVVPPQGGSATYDVSYDRQDRFQVRKRL